MSLEELKSKERREEDKQLMKENMDKAMVAQVERSISTSLQCGKCKQKKVSYSQAQTRSADEPMTVCLLGMRGVWRDVLTVARRFASARIVGTGGSSVEGMVLRCRSYGVSI
jgi:transposase